MHREPVHQMSRNGLNQHSLTTGIGRVIMLLLTLVLLGACAGEQEPTVEVSSPLPTASPSASPMMSDAASPSPTPAIVSSTPTMDETETPVVEALPSGITVTVAQLASNLDRYLGQTVTVQSDVDRVLGPHHFMLDENAVLAGGIDSDLWVISPSFTISDVITDGMVAEVTGTVRRVVSGEVEDENDLDLDLFGQATEGRAILIAQTVRRVPLLSESGEPATDPTITEQYGQHITIAEVVGNAADFQGKTVTVSGDVQRAIGTHALVLDEDALLAGGIDNDLLVIGAPVPVTLSDEDRVQVTGTVRTLDLVQIEQETGLDLQDEEFAVYKDRLVLVAQSIALDEM